MVSRCCSSYSVLVEVPAIFVNAAEQVSLEAQAWYKYAVGKKLILTTDRGVICNSVKLNIEYGRPTDVPDVLTADDIQYFTKILFRLMQLVCTRF